MATQQEVIKAFMKSLDKTTKSGRTAINSAVKACSNFKSLQDVVDNLISDCQSATSADNFLLEKCGIIIGNADTGAITGKDAGGSKIKTAESIVSETAKASYPSGTSFTRRGLKVIVPKKSKLTTAQQTVIQGLYSWWIDGALKLIEESYGYSFKNSDASVKKITVNFIEDSNVSTLAYVTPGLVSVDSSPFKADSLTLTINMSWFKNLSEEDTNGTGERGSFYLDRVIAHELTHAIMAAKINNTHKLPNFIMEGLAELTHGIDNERASDLRGLVKNPSIFQERLNAANDSSADTHILDYSAGYIFLRYLAKQASDDKDKISDIEGTSSNDSLSIGNILDVKIYGYSGNDTITSHGSNITIDSGKGNDSVISDGNKVFICGGSGKDSIYNLDGSSLTIDGGTGNDFIINTGKKISISGGAGDDKIYNEGASVTISAGTGNDTIQNVSSKVKVYGGSGDDDIYNNGANVTINAGIGNDYIQNESSKVKVYGGSGDDYIYNNGASVTISGGKGNDTLWGENGSANFIYASGDGKDVILGFGDNDTLTFDRLDFTASYSKKNNAVTFNVDGGSVNIKDFTATTFHVNDDTYKISGSKFKKVT